MYTQKEFIEKSRTKFPEFQNMDDSQVLKTMLEKYPIYKNQISDYKEKGLLEKSLDYGLETGGKILKGTGNLLTDGINIVGGGISKNILGVEKEDVKLFDYQKQDPNFNGGFTQRTINNFGDALDATWQGAKVRQQRLNSQRDDNSFSGIVKGDLKNMGSSFRTAFDFGGNLLGAVNNTIGDGLMTAGATLIPDETQEELKGYIAEKISESETLTNLVQKIEEYGEVVEYMRENAPEDYATHKASIGFLEGFLDLATAKTGGLAIKGAKNAYNSSLKITKNMINKASDELNKIAPLKEKYFSKVNIDDLKEKGKDAFKFSKENVEGISPVTGKKFEIEKTPGLYDNITDAVIGATDNEVLATKSIFPKLTKEKSATTKINAGKTALEGVEQLYDDFANGIIKSDIHTMQGGVEGVSEALEHWGRKIGDLTKVDGNIDFTPELKDFSKILDDKTFAFSGKAGKFAENIIKNFENVGNNLTIKETQQVLSNLKAELFSSAENINIFNKSETGRQVLNFVDNITKKLDSTIENLAGNSTELKTAKTNYAKYKKIEKDLLNSFLVDARKNTNGLAGLSGDMMGVYDILKNPLNVGNTLQAMAFKHIGNLMGKNSSRGGAWEKLIRNLDRQAVKKAGVDDGGKFFTKKSNKKGIVGGKEPTTTIPYTKIITDFQKKANKFIQEGKNGELYYEKVDGSKIYYKKTVSPLLGADGETVTSGSILKNSKKSNKNSKKFSQFDRWAFKTEVELPLKGEFNHYEKILDDIQVGKIEKAEIGIVPKEAWNDGKARHLDLSTGIYEKIFKKHGPFSNKNFIATANEWTEIIKNVNGVDGHINIIKRIPGTDKGFLIGAKRENGAFITTHFEPTKNIDDLLIKSKDNGGEILTKTQKGKIETINFEDNSKLNYTNIDSSKYKAISNAEAEEIVKKYFKDEVGVEFLEKIKTREGLEALGRYKDELIEFAKNPKENVVHHEALHAYFDLAVEPKKQREILDLIKKDKNFKTDLDAEEWLADSFADFVIGRQDVSKISFRLKNFLSDLAFKFKKFFGREDKVEALFRDLEDIGKGKKDFEVLNRGSGKDKFFSENIDKNNSIIKIVDIRSNLEKLAKENGIDIKIKLGTNMSIKLKNFNANIKIELKKNSSSKKKRSGSFSFLCYFFLL